MEGMPRSPRAARWCPWRGRLGPLPLTWRASSETPPAPARSTRPGTTAGAAPGPSPRPCTRAAAGAGRPPSRRTAATSRQLTSGPPRADGAGTGAAGQRPTGGREEGEGNGRGALGATPGGGGATKAAFPKTILHQHQLESAKISSFECQNDSKSQHFII